MAPKSNRRAPKACVHYCEVLIIALATAALAASTGAALAVIFAVVATVNAALDHALARTHRPAARGYMEQSRHAARR